MKKRTILSIDAQGVADFRAQLDAQIAEAQRSGAILPPEKAMTATDEPFALSPRDAAARLGIDASTLYRHYGAAMRSGKIRTLRIGRAVRIIWRSLVEYIEDETRRAA